MRGPIDKEADTDDQHPEKTKDASPIRVFPERAHADEAVVDEVGDALVTNMVPGRP